VVVRRTGLTPDLLRAWERRYKAVSPTRSGGRRLYSDADVERLDLLRRAVRQGRRISQVAGLETEELRKLVAADEKAAARTTGDLGGVALSRAGSEEGVADSYFQACLEATRSLDERRLEDLLAQATVALPRPAILEQVVVPLLRSVGEMWRDGSLRVAQEHLVTAVIRTFLGPMADSSAHADSAPRLLVGTPAGQLHELGALIATAVAVSAGWRAVYLGPNLPAEEIAAGAQMAGARVIALSIIFPPDDPQVVQELTRLRRLVPDTTTLLIGGASAAGYDSTIDSIGGARLGDMPSFRAVLEGLRVKPR